MEVVISRGLILVKGSKASEVLLVLHGSKNLVLEENMK